MSDEKTYREGDDDTETPEQKRAGMHVVETDKADEALDVVEAEAKTKEEIMADKLAAMDAEPEVDGEDEEAPEPEFPDEEVPTLADPEGVATGILVLRFNNGGLNVISDIPGLDCDHEATAPEIYSLLHEANEAGLVSRTAVACQQVMMPTIHKLLQQFASTMRAPGAPGGPGGFRANPKKRR